MQEIKYRPIGIIHTPFKELKGMPIQPIGGKEVEGSIEIDRDFVEGLIDLDGFSHIILIYHFHRSKDFSLKVKPFLDNQLRGLFSTRAPRRPNPIGLSVVRLVAINDNILHIKNIDIVDGTPLLDIKPYIPHTDPQDVERIGWLQESAHRFHHTQSDKRFTS